MDIAYQAPAIFVQDIAASRRFYEELLGQEVKMDFGPAVDFAGGFHLWQIDHAFQTIYGRAPDAIQRPRSHNVELHFETADAKAASIRLAEAGVEFVHPLSEMPWGKRIFRVRDPDGHVIAVGEPMPAVIARLLDEGLAVESVIERTAMPAELVKQIAQEEKK
jgi:catechol 2,3-dioxygenase-like lactoylglutathione lyase family enzyme